MERDDDLQVRKKTKITKPDSGVEKKRGGEERKEAVVLLVLQTANYLAY